MKCIVCEMIKITLAGLWETIVLLAAFTVVIGVPAFVWYGINTLLVMWFGQKVRDIVVLIVLIAGLFACVISMFADLYKKAKVNCVTKGE